MSRVTRTQFAAAFAVYGYNRFRLILLTRGRRLITRPPKPVWDGTVPADTYTMGPGAPGS